MNVAGKIFPEYWVDCFKCRGAHACAENTPAKAAVQARRLGWIKKRPGGWCCPLCQKD